MAFRNTSERYEYIYGSNVRKLEESNADNIKQNTVRKKQSVPKSKSTEPVRHSHAVDTKAAARIQKNKARFLAFDW